MNENVEYITTSGVDLDSEGHFNTIQRDKPKFSDVISVSESPSSHGRKQRVVWERHREANKPMGEPRWLWPTHYKARFRTENLASGDIYSDNGRGFDDWRHRATSIRYTGYHPTVIQKNYICPTLNYGLEPDIDPDRLEMAAITGAINKLAAHEVDYGVLAVEAGRTYGLVAKTLTTLTKAMKHAKAKRWKRAARTLGIRSKRRYSSAANDTAGRWLELQYGWMPLYSDVYGAVKDLKRACFLPGDPVTCKKVQSVEAQEVDKTGDGSQFILQTVTNKWKVGCFVRLDFKVGEEVTAELASTGLLNPATMVWEAIRFSFIWDWWNPLGSTMKAMGLLASKAFDFVSGSCSFMRRGTVSSVWMIDSPGRNPNYWQYNMKMFVSANFQDFNLDRKVYSECPAPTPYLRDPFSIKRAVNALALWRVLSFEDTNPKRNRKRRQSFSA